MHGFRHSDGVVITKRALSIRIVCEGFFRSDAKRKKVSRRRIGRNEGRGGAGFGNGMIVAGWEMLGLSLGGCCNS